MKLATLYRSLKRVLKSEGVVKAAVALKYSSLRSPREVRDRIDALIHSYNRDAHPFRWRAAEARPSAPQPTIADVPE